MNSIVTGNMVFIKDIAMRGVVTSIQTEVQSIGCGRARGPIKVNVIVAGTNQVIMGLTLADLEEACDFAYKVGDKVRSKLGGGFTGIVMGFEITTNRVVCAPDHSRPSSSNDRVRYSYGLDEIEELPNEYTFKLNARYKINGNGIARVVESPVEGEKFLLINEDSGKLLVRLQEEAVHWNNLRSFGIKNIQYMK